MSVREVDKVDQTISREVITTSARAFYDDPLFNFFQPDALRQQRTLPGFFGAAAHDVAAHGRTFVAEIDGRVRGTALWYPPGVSPPSGGVRALRQARRSASALLSTGSRLRDAVALMNATVRHHPHYPHWYLAVLAVDPTWQGKGLGGELLAPILEICDREGLPAYLETQKESNLAFYGRFGFAVTEELVAGRCPMIWTMTREPRTP